MSDVPAAAGEIDAGWLTDALQPRFPGARVASVEVTDQRQVTNAHARVRVTYDEPVGAPATMFAKLLPSDPQRRQSIIGTGMGEREVRFYEQLAPALPMRLPMVYVARERADGEFILLLEDLDATGCVISDGPMGVPPDSVARALEDLAALHLRFVDPATRVAQVPWIPSTSSTSDYGSRMLRYGLDIHRDRLSDEFAEMAELCIAHPDALQDLWHRGPQTVIHGDPHIGNLFFDGGRVGFLDWGIINVNTPMRDVSYFLTMSLTVDDRRRLERDLLAHYLDIWNAGGDEPISWDDAWLAHRVHAGYTVLASCQVVTFPSDATPQRQVFAAAFLERSQAAVADLDARAAIREFGGL
ncbi:MAG: phosphotransferase [Acidimicrobiia bacterium]